MIANLGPLPKYAEFGIVREVHHTYRFVTARVEPSDGVRLRLVEGEEFIYINVWSAYNRSEKYVGVRFCGIEYPGDRAVARMPSRGPLSREGQSFAGERGERSDRKPRAQSVNPARPPTWDARATREATGSLS